MLRMLVMLGILSLLLESGLLAVHGLSISRSRTLALHAITTQVTAAQSQLLRYEQHRAATSPAGADSPAALSTCVQTIQGTCALHVDISTSPLNEIGGDVRNQQDNSLVAEHRIFYRLVAKATQKNGSVIATRSFVVTLRIFVTAPFVALGASRDESIQSLPGGAGDDGGFIPTTVHVLYKDAATGATFSGDIFTQATAPPPAPSWSN